jgi:PKD repeat protein
MKKFTVFFILSGFLLIVPGCNKTDSSDQPPVAKDPYGMFQYSIKTNGIVSFTNTSENATSYLWDFGDLTTSTSAAVTFDHQYLQNGSYKVTLTAYGNGKSAGAYANLDITSIISQTVTDIDGNVYHTVTIGTQVWMVENLKTTKYRNGDPIPNVTDSTTWGNSTTGAYCNYNNDANNSTTYGRLYN